VDADHTRGSAGGLERLRPGLRLVRGELVVQQRCDLIGLRVTAKHRLGEDERFVDVHVEDAAYARYYLDHLDDLFPLLKDLRRQTGGVWQRASGNAVFDPDAVAVRHRVTDLSTVARGRSAHARGMPTQLCIVVTD